MPVNSPLSYSVKFFIKFGWPTEALDLLLEGRSIPSQTYTDEQATKFVANGLAYYEQTFSGPHLMFNALGSELQPISGSFVYGTDDASAMMGKARWRWLPLVNGFDAQRRPIWHTAKWDNGAPLKSLDLLRLDYYYWGSVRFFVPTAIVRPLQVGKGFGRGLQFTTVYEFPTSFAHFLREPTLQSVERFYNAIQAQSHQWLALISGRNRDLLRSAYERLMPGMIGKGLLVTFAKQGRHVTAGPVWPGFFAEDLEQRLPAYIQRPPFVQHPSIEVAETHYNEHTDVPQIVSFELTQPQHIKAHPPSNWLSSLPDTTLQLGRGPSTSHIYAPSAQRPESLTLVPSDSWARDNAESSGSSSTGFSPGSGPSGFTPWRRQ